jgi:hypothetical protein
VSDDQVPPIPDDAIGKLLWTLEQRVIPVLKQMPKPKVGQWDSERVYMDLEELVAAIKAPKTESELHTEIFNAFVEIDILHGVEDDGLVPNGWYIAQGWRGRTDGQPPTTFWSVPFMGQHAIDMGVTSRDRAAAMVLNQNQKNPNDHVVAGAVFRLPLIPHSIFSQL